MKIRNFGDVKTILFNNLTVKQTIFKNTFWIALADGINKFLKLALIIYVARILGATEYGKFSFALAFISLFIVFANLGVSSIVIREFSRERKKEKDFFSILSLKFTLSVITLVLILIGSFFVTPDPNIRKVIWILAVFCLIGDFSRIVHSFFKARQKMEYMSWPIILESLIVAGIGFFIILNFPSIINLSYAYLLSALIALTFSLTLFHFKIFHLKISWKIKIWQKFLGMSWPLALASIFSTVYVFIDSTMMGYLNQIAETGWYNAAYKIIISTSVLMGIISTSFYPVLSKFFKESKKQLQKIWNYQIELIITLAVPLMIGGFILAPKIINFFYGQGFEPSILAFQILLITVGAVYFSGPLGQVLIVANQQKKIFLATFLGAMINIILNLILIPKFSLYGAAVSTVITYLLITFLYFYFVRKLTPIQPLNLKLFFSLIIISLSSIIMYFVISWHKVYNLHVFLSVIIGTSVYFISLLILRKVTKPIYVFIFS